MHWKDKLGITDNVVHKARKTARRRRVADTFFGVRKHCNQTGEDTGSVEIKERIDCLYI